MELEKLGICHITCKYCQSDKNIIDEYQIEYPNRVTQVFMFKDELCVESHAKNGESFVANDKISYCPMCGRKLSV